MRERMTTELDLRLENERLRNMCIIMEQMSVLLMPFIQQCKCNAKHYIINKTELNVLKLKYNQLKQNCKQTQTRVLNASTKTRVIKCEFIGCSQQFQNKQQLTSHRESEHNGEQRAHVCDWPGCDTRFVNRSNVLKHMKKQHLNTKQYKCDVRTPRDCFAVFADKRKLIVHQVNEHNHEKPFQCDWPGCDFKTCYPQKLNLHKHRHTGEKQYKCVWPQCDSTFRQKSHLTTHLLRHTGEKPFECEFCSKRFQALKAMKFHVKSKHNQLMLS